MTDKLFCWRQNSGLQPWMISERFFCLRFARFHFNFRRGLLRIWIADICSNFLDVRENASCVAKQCRIRKICGRQFESGRKSSIAMVGQCLGTCSHSDAMENRTRPMNSRHSLSHSIDHMSLVMVDHVRSNNPERSFQTYFTILRTTKQSFV